MLVSRPVQPAAQSTKPAQVQSGGLRKSSRHRRREGARPPASSTAGPPRAEAEQVCDLPARSHGEGGPTRFLGQSHTRPGARDGRGGRGLTAPKGGFQEKRVPLGTPAQSRVATEETEVGVSSLGVRPAGAFAQAAPRGGDLAADLRRGPGLGHGWASTCSESRTRRTQAPRPQGPTRQAERAASLRLGGRRRDGVRSALHGAGTGRSLCSSPCSLLGSPQLEGGVYPGSSGQERFSGENDHVLVRNSTSDAN